MEYQDKTGTAPGATVYSERSLYFDGGNDHVVIPDDPALDFDITDPFSVSTWVFPRSTTAYDGLVAKGTSGAHWKIEYYGYWVYYPHGLIRITLYGSTAGLFEVYIGGSGNDYSLPFTEWFHLVVTYDGSNDASNIKAYINGEEWPVYVRYNIAMAGTMINASPVWIGRATGYLGGYQDEVSIWNKVLDQADVTELWNGGDPDNLYTHASVANLAGWWRMGEASVDGTIRGMTPAAIGTDTPGGSFSTESLVFNNAGHVTMGNSLDWDRDQARSYSFWIKTTTTAISVLIQKLGSGDPSGWNLTANNTGTLVLSLIKVFLTDDLVVESSVTINDGSWHHVVVTWSGSTGTASDCKMYFDGTEDTSLSIVRNALTGSIANNYDFMLGSYVGPIQPFAGTLDEVAVYGTELSSGDVTAIYNAGVPTDLLALSSGSGLIGWWQMGEDIQTFLNEYFAFSGLLWLPASSSPEFGP
jgi:hypothetical protein